MIETKNKKGDKVPFTSEQVSEITVSVSRKVNLGNYESKDYFLSLKANKYPDQLVTDIVNALRVQAEKMIDAMCENKVPASQTRELRCLQSECGKLITLDQKEFTEREYGKALCRDCEEKFYS